VAAALGDAFVPAGAADKRGLSFVSCSAYNFIDTNLQLCALILSSVETFCPKSASENEKQKE
jgi:hypothetical protein